MQSRMHLVHHVLSLDAGKETVYEEEVAAYEIRSVSLTDAKHAATGEDTTVSSAFAHDFAPADAIFHGGKPHP